MTEILTLINNTTEIDLLDTNGVILISWEPSLAPWKEITTSPFLGDGSNLLIRNFEDIIETFQFAIVGISQDDVTTRLNNLLGVLELGVQYEMGNYDYPTYIKVKPNSTTNISYGRVKKYKIDRLPQVFGDSPFSTGALSRGYVKASALAYINIALSVPWYQDVAPGNSNTTLMQATESFDGTVRGTVNSSQTTQPVNSVYVAPKYNVANFNAIFRFDTSASTFSSTLVNASLPQNLFPSPIGSGDILYLGVTSIANSGPTSSAVFDIATPASVAMTIAWEAWTGAGWTAVSDLRDETDGFSATGRRIVTFTPPSAMTTTTINSTVAWWVRARITALNGNSTVPTQQNRNIYSVTWPYAEIEAATIKGQIPALISLKVRNTGSSEITRVISGLRSYSRGSSFYPYWNMALANGQLPLAINSVASNYSDAFRGYYPAGKAINISEAGTGADVIFFDFYLGDSKSYRGKFKLFMGVDLISISGTPALSDLKFRVEVKTLSDAVIMTTKTKNISTLTTNTVQLIDFGEYEFIPKIRELVNYDLFRFSCIHQIASGKTVNYRGVFLAFIPSDECLIDSLMVEGSSGTLEEGVYYKTSGISGLDNDSFLASEAGDIFRSPVVPRSPKLPFVQSNARQRLWFLNASGSDSNLYSTSYVMDIQVGHVARYLTCLRGSS